MIYFTADTHFGHEHFLKYTYRPFSSVQEMTNYIIDSINNTVNINDVLYIVGDFCGRTGNPMKYANKIKCQNMHLILGNHDIEKRCGDYFTSVNQYKEIKHQGQRIIMSHYPMRRWSKDYRGSWMLYGHVHGHLSHEDFSDNRKTLDVGVDNSPHGFRFGTPWSFDQIKRFFRRKDQKSSSLGIDIDDSLLYDKRNVVK